MKKLGFGLMRLPKNGDEIDIPQVCEMVDKYIESGFEYFDTAYVYAGSEAAFGKAVASRYPRSRFTLASKMSGWLLNDGFSAAQMFEEQKRRCCVDYFDYYLIHSFQNSRIQAYNKYGVWDFCRSKKESGEIKHLGFSFHGDPDLLEETLNRYPFIEFVQLQINYVDWENQAIYSRRNYEICVAHNKPVIVMEPVKGGILANLRPELEAIFKEQNPVASNASYALRYAGSLENVMMVLSGMSNMEQLNDNLQTFSDFCPLNDGERKAIEQVRKGFLEVPTVQCTSCQYCMEGCPKHIAIPDIIKGYNMLLTFGEHNRPYFYYEDIVSTRSARASECIQCGRCEKVCPQHLPIRSILAKSSALFDSRR